jgi:ankyrin repeat protein
MPTRDELIDALGRGQPEEVAALITAGADIRYEGDHGYDALIDAVHGRDIRRDDRLLELLQLLVDNGVDLRGESSYRESGLRVLSRIGRFDGVRLLLDAGADKEQLGWTPLIEAVAIGTLAEVDALAVSDTVLEQEDWWERTAWLVALLAGDIEKAKLLRKHGANVHAKGRCGKPPLHYAVMAHSPEVVGWLISTGQPVDQADEFGGTALMEAVESDDLECFEVLLAAGADIEKKARRGNALEGACSARMIHRLLDAGADPSRLTREGHRALCGLSDGVEALAAVTKDAFHRARSRRPGKANPEQMDEPFWRAMIRDGPSAYEAKERFAPNAPYGGPPVWSAVRFGQAIVFLPDGRIVQIAGEHEDHYDPDFCIYNDVFVHGQDGSITIYGYPDEVFPPTDFHTATLVDGAIWIIGSLGYPNARRFGETPVYRLDTATFGIERLIAGGDAPGWIYGHRAVVVDGAIWISGGTIATMDGSKEVHSENVGVFVLEVDRLHWKCGSFLPATQDA